MRLSLLIAPILRQGRNIEVPSEDPYHSGEYAEYFVKGMEQAPEDPYHIQASACCKVGSQRTHSFHLCRSYSYLHHRSTMPPTQWSTRLNVA